MRFWERLRQWVRANWRRSRAEREMDAELRLHMELYADELVRRGLPAEEARQRARAEFGGVEKAKEECREARGMSLLESLAADARYGVRALRKSPGFAIVAILTLALGIGANTAVFSLLHGLTNRTLPVPHPEQLVRFGAQSGDDPYVALSVPMFEEFARRQTAFSSTFAWWGDAVINIEINGVLSRADIWAVSGDYYSGFGTAPEIGRLIGRDDANLRAASAERIAVLSYSFWQRRYGRDPTVIGQTIKIEGVPFTIAGVTRRGFGGISAEDEPEVTVPLPAVVYLEGDADADVQKYLRNGANLSIEAAGRLRPGLTLEEARAHLESLWPRVREDVKPANLPAARQALFSALRLKVESGATGASFLRKRFAPALKALLAIAGLVLLVACVNLASLTLARSNARSHELSVRVALGAGRLRLVRQAVTENLVISLAGSVAGLVLAYWGSTALSAFVIRETYIVPAAIALAPDLRILAFAAAAAMVTGLLVALAPAWRATRIDPQEALQKGGRGTGSGSSALSRALIVAQVALSVVLVTGAGLFVRSLQKLQDVDVGFRTRSVITVFLAPKPGGYKKFEVSYYRELTERVLRIPGVLSAGMVKNLPGGMIGWTEKVRVKETNEEGLQADFETCMPGFFETTGIGLLRGRSFQWQDDEHGRKVAIVSASFAQEYLRGEPLGQHLDVMTGPAWQNLEIVGIVTDASLFDVRKHAPPTVYLPTTQYGSNMGWGEILVETGLAGEGVASEVRKIVDALGREYVVDVKPLAHNLDRSLLRERVTALLSGFFGGMALLLAAIGVYGLMAYSVSRRVREIGVRVALGAQRAAVRRLVLGEALKLAAAGLVIGLIAARAGSRFIAGMLYGVSAADPVTLAGVSLILLCVAASSAWIPARRAMRVDPMTALRQE